MGLFCDSRWLWDKIRDRLDAQDAILRDVQAKVQKVWMWTQQPSSISLVVVSEGADAMLRFKVQMPARPESDSDWAEITGGKLVVTIGAAAPIVILTPKSIEEGLTPADRLLGDEAFVGAQGESVTLRFAHLDNAEPTPNESTYVEKTQVLVDNVPPVPPTSIGLIEVEEFEPAPPVPPVE